MKHNKNYQTLEEINSKENNELMDLLKEKVPSIFHDGVLSLEALKQELNLVEDDQDINEKYGLYWKGKFEALNKSKIPSLKTLISEKDKSLNFDKAENIIIEGDNLEVLKLLQKSYFNKVDVIYIDPPYNTGNDFVYNDNFKENSLEYKIQNGLIDEEGYKTTTNQKSDGRFHTNWLNMIYPRLILARKLLKEDGVIFISIDDNEQARLKMVCDEIFGEQNFVANLIWRKKNTGGGSDKVSIEIETEYIIIYAKNWNLLNLNSKPIEFDKYTLSDDFEKERGKYNLVDLDRVSSPSSFQYIESLDYLIQAPNGTMFKNHRNIIKPRSYCYTLGKELFDFYQKNGFIEIKKTKEGYWKAYRKSYSLVTIDRKQKKIVPRENGNSYNNIIDNGKITTSSGKKELIKIIEDKSFSFPKPKELIKFIANLIKNKNSLVLDFFAGSGTTAQAVMELNKEDGGNRRYILVQLLEKIENSSEFKTICDITRERVKRSNKMFDYQDKGFKSFKLVDSNFKVNNMSNKDSKKEIEKNLFDLTNKIKEGRTTEDLVYEIILRNGHPLNLSTKLINEMIENHNVYYDENKNHLFILEVQNNGFYSNESVLKIINKIYKEGQLEFTIYFKDNHFKNDQDKLNIVEQIMFINTNIKIIII